MKKIAFMIILAAIIANVVQAQSVGIRFADFKGESAPKFQVIGLNDGAADIIDVNSKALKDFLKSCRKAENAHWYIEADGNFVYYYVNGNKARRFYDKKGNLVYNILTLPEKSLPFSIRNLVKQFSYFDYSIDLGEEIQTEGKTFYVVHISDAKTIKILTILDGEITVLKDLDKTK
jgi:hypothetical protein